MNLKEHAESLGIKVDGRWSEARIQEEIDNMSMMDKVDISEMNDLANRIWEGQSSSLPKKVRMSRIIFRLKNKGYTDTDIESLNVG